VSTEELVARVGDRLRERGDRMTRPRAAVLAALAGMPGPVTIEEVVDAVARADPAVHRASVYRAGATLAGLGVGQHIHLGHGATAYHLTDAVGPHPHAQCRRCGRVEDLPADLFERVASRLADEHGFALDAGHVALSGLCAACARA